MSGLAEGPVAAGELGEFLVHFEGEGAVVAAVLVVSWGDEGQYLLSIYRPPARS